MNIKKIKWIEPEIMAHNIYSKINPKDFIFLHSSRNDKFNNGTKSIIAFDMQEELILDNFNELKEVISKDKKRQDNMWFGYLAYDLKNTLENVYEEKITYIDTPNIQFKKFKNVIEFDHLKKEVAWFSKDKHTLELIEADAIEVSSQVIKISDLKSNMSDSEYLKLVEDIRSDIIEGTYYEANFTRKFFGEHNIENKFAVYLELAKKSPAQYGAFIKFDDLYIISSSPESFLRSDSEGNVIAQPIKGTIGITSQDGEEERNELMNSEKDKAENLMIVDLMRNDLSRSCEVGSVNVPHLFEITSYPHLHHLSSVITGKKRAEVSNVELIERCFPPGSMTGTPKVKMMDEIAKKERYKRGIYSGAIGYFAGDGSFDFSVVIRTIIIKRDKFEFQVGGAVVFDSTPEGELDESNIKAKKIKEILGL